MHILPLLILALLLSCTASKKERKPEEQTTPPQTPEYLPNPMGASPATKSTSGRTDGRMRGRDTGPGKYTTSQDDTGKETAQHEDTNKIEDDKETVQHEDAGKVGEGTQPEQPEQPDEGTQPEQPEESEEAEETAEPEVLSVKLSFVASDDVLYPQLEFSEQYLAEISDVELKHTRAVTLKLEDNAQTLASKGIKLPKMAFWLKLKWGDKTCHERIEVEDMTQVTEVLCR